MKNLLVSIFLVLGVIKVSSAQLLMFGGRVGADNWNFKSLKFTNTTTSENLSIVYNNSNLAYHFGVFGRVKLAGLYVQPELLYSINTVQYDLQSSITGNSLVKQDFASIQMPVLFGYKVSMFRVQAGVEANFILNDVKSNQIIQELNNFTYGYQVGLGIDIFKKLIVDFKYGGNLSGIGDGVKIGGNTYDFDNKPGRFILSVGYSFKKI